MPKEKNIISAIMPVIEPLCKTFAPPYDICSLKFMWLLKFRYRSAFVSCMDTALYMLVGLWIVQLCMSLNQCCVLLTPLLIQRLEHFFKITIEAKVVNNLAQLSTQAIGRIHKRTLWKKGYNLITLVQDFCTTIWYLFLEIYVALEVLL